MWKNIVTQIYFLILLRFISCCECNLNHSDKNIEKREQDFEDYGTSGSVYSTTDPPELNETTEKEITLNTLPQSTSEIHETATESTEINTEATGGQTATEQHSPVDHNLETVESSSDIVDIVEDSILESRSNESTTEAKTLKMNSTTPSTSDLIKKCRYYKNGNYFTLKKMADSWRVVYYRLPNRLKCFKLNIKYVTDKEQKHYAKVFGNFNNTVDWSQCFLEITSDVRDNSGRRHFLQGSDNENGVMENIIIDEEYCQNTTYLTLHRETGDQWLVVENLLVMRDCENADYVVFGRVPTNPREEEIFDALTYFGEYRPNGTAACTDHVDKSSSEIDDMSQEETTIQLHIL